MSPLNLVFGTVNGESEFVAREMAGYLCATEVPHRLWEAEELEGWLPPQAERNTRYSLLEHRLRRFTGQHLSLVSEP